MSRNNYPANIQNQQQSIPQSLNNILQVMGPESALAYQVGPNSRVILMDSNRPVFYIKRSDDSGYSETKAYQFKEIPLMQENINDTTQQDFVTRTEFDEFKQVIEDLVMKNE